MKLWMFYAAAVSLVHMVIGVEPQLILEHQESKRNTNVSSTIPVPIPVGDVSLNSTIPAPIPVGDVSRIIGGHPTSIEEFPWQVYLNGCGGSIISMNWIMSAAHCFCNDTFYDYFEIIVTRIDVFAGLTYRSKKNTDPDVQHRIINEEEIQDHLFVHPEYKKGVYLNNDIALIKLKKPLTLNEKVQPIDIADTSDYIPGKELIASGWGKTADDEAGPNILRYVDGLILISKEECKKAYWGIYATDKNICHKTKNKNICRGDSGGPVICGIGSSNGPPYVQIGINSFVSGRGCEAHEPGAFTDVSLFRQWIYGITKECKDRANHCHLYVSHCHDKRVRPFCQKTCNVCGPDKLRDE